MDITVHQSDQRRAPGPPEPPGAAGAALGAVRGRPGRPPRAGSPDRDYYQQAAERLGGNRACLAVARKLLKRSYHTLRELGEEALAARMNLPRARAALTHTDAPRPAPCMLPPPRPRGRP